MSERSDIKPITYLKNRTAELVREVSEQRRTVTITHNGEAKVVVMDADTYDRWRSAMARPRFRAQWAEAAVRDLEELLLERLPRGH